MQVYATPNKTNIWIIDLNFKKLQEVILHKLIHAYVCEKVLGNA